MKNVKKDAANFKTLDALQMLKIKGGTYIVVTNPDGTVTRVQV